MYADSSVLTMHLAHWHLISLFFSLQRVGSILNLMVISTARSISVQSCRRLSADAKHCVKQQLVVMDSIMVEAIRHVGSKNVPPTRRKHGPMQMGKHG
jgi:hypothetical protein